MKVFFVFFCALVFSQQASISDNKRGLRISNGTAVAPYSIPYQVFIWIFPPLGNVDRYACGGVLITAKTILTSAQCISRISMATIYAGVTDPFNNDQNLNQFRNLYASTPGIKIHEKFSPITLENNIGIIELAVPFDLNERVALANLPKQSDAVNDFVGQQGRVSGWVNARFHRPEVLVAINNTIISNVECNRIFGNVKEYEICLSGEGSRRACAGDEGGPLVIGNTVQGIISYRNGNCQSTNPTVNTKIAPFLNWIEKNSDYRQ